MQQWFIEGCIDQSGLSRKLRIGPFPFLIGRIQGLGLSIHSENVSRHHAEIQEENGVLTLKDLKSTNGSFVNHQPVKEVIPLKPGDILHIADLEFRLSCESGEEPDEVLETLHEIRGFAENLPAGAFEIEEMLASAQVDSVFQAIVKSRDESLTGFEILGRGTHPKLPKAPGALLKIAENSGCAVVLTELMRDNGVQMAEDSGSPLMFFINIHPQELDDPERLLQSVQVARAKHPGPNLVLEIHEKAVTGLQGMKDLSARLRDLGVGIAYDDFGAGQTRLLELAEVPPDYLKFDIALIKNIDRSEARQEMLGHLITLSKTLHTQTLAEGISNAHEAATCRRLGFDLLQGYYYGRPANFERAALGLQAHAG